MRSSWTSVQEESILKSSMEAACLHGKFYV